MTTKGDMGVAKKAMVVYRSTRIDIGCYFP